MTLALRCGRDLADEECGDAERKECEKEQHVSP
jgi:hypothetical protein